MSSPLGDLAATLSSLVSKATAGLQLFWKWARSWGTLVATAIFAVGSLGREFNVPSEKFWSENSDWAFGGLFALGLFALTVGPANSVLQERRQKRGEKDPLVRELCRQILLAVSDDYDEASVRAVGVHAWRLSGNRVEHIEGFHLEPREDTRTKWPKGVGVVGQSCEGNDRIEGDCTNLHRAAATGEAEYMKIASNKRFNLDWAAYQRTKRFWYVYAVPIRGKKDEVIGCLSIDCVEVGNAAAFFEACKGVGVVGPLATMQELLREA
jgi:hypothetical protein